MAPFLALLSGGFKVRSRHFEWSPATTSPWGSVSSFRSFVLPFPVGAHGSHGLDPISVVLGCFRWFLEDMPSTTSFSVFWSSALLWFDVHWSASGSHASPHFLLIQLAMLPPFDFLFLFVLYFLILYIIGFGLVLLRIVSPLGCARWVATSIEGLAYLLEQFSLYFDPP